MLALRLWWLMKLCAYLRHRRLWGCLQRARLCAHSADWQDVIVRVSNQSRFLINLGPGWIDRFACRQVANPFTIWSPINLLRALIDRESVSAYLIGSRAIAQRTLVSSPVTSLAGKLFAFGREDSNKKHSRGSQSTSLQSIWEIYSKQLRMLMIGALYECWFGDKIERVISLSENFLADVCVAHTNSCRHSIPPIPASSDDKTHVEGAAASSRSGGGGENRKKVVMSLLDISNKSRFSAGA